MKIRLLCWMLAAFLIGGASPTAFSADDTESDANIGQGALVGASTQVVGDAAVEALADPVAKQAPWWTTLKRAFTGAATGAIAAKTSGAGTADDVAASSDKQSTPSANSEKKIRDEKHDKLSKKHPKKKHEGRRPPGWDKGKKVGWHGKDTPPGLSE